MKINRLETHDRLIHLKKEHALNVSKGAEDCLKRNPLSLALQAKAPYIYLFAHPRTMDDGVTKKMYWQPRLSRPSAQTNSYLFRALSNTDSIEICWMLPPRETWSQYKKGNVTEHEIVMWSIDQFTQNLKQLEAPLKDDISDSLGAAIYQSVFSELRQEQITEDLWKEIKQEFSGV